MDDHDIKRCYLLQMHHLSIRESWNITSCRWRRHLFMREECLNDTVSSHVYIFCNHKTEDERHKVPDTTRPNRDSLSSEPSILSHQFWPTSALYAIGSREASRMLRRPTSCDCSTPLKYRVEIYQAESGTADWNLFVMPNGGWNDPGVGTSMMQL